MQKNQKMQKNANFSDRMRTGVFNMVWLYTIILLSKSLFLNFSDWMRTGPFKMVWPYTIISATSHHIAEQMICSAHLLDRDTYV